MKKNNKIKEFRILLGISQDAFASLLDVSQSAISFYEKGIRKPRVEIANKILLFARSKKFKISMEDIYKI